MPNLKSFIIAIFYLIVFQVTFLYAQSVDQKVIDSLQNCLKIEKDEKIKVHLLVDLSAVYTQVEPETAKDYALTGYNLALKVKDHESAANALNNLAVCYYYQGNLEKALENYQKALEIDKTHKMQKNIATRLNNIGMVYNDMAQYDLAIDYYEQALEIDLKYGNKDQAAVRYNNIGMIYAHWGQYNQAVENFTKALEIDKESGDKERIAIRLNNIGMIFYYMNNFEEAKKYFEEALAIDKKLDNQKNIAIRLNNLGKVLSGAGDYTQALAHFNESRELSEKMQNLPDIAISLKNTGLVYLKLNDSERARVNAKKALEINRQIGNTYEIADIYLLLGDIYKLEENFTEAVNSYRKSLEIADSINHKSLLMNVFQNLSLCFEKVNIIDSALIYYKKYSESKDSIFSENNHKELAYIQALYEKEKSGRMLAEKNKEIAELNAEKESIIKQRYALILGILVLAVIFVGIFLFRRYKESIQRNKLKHELNSYMQKALRQQMNPHFIFNTLSSIQYFILQNDNISSNKYLSKFAGLMRMVLENSSHNTVSIEQELDALKLYLELEQLRFENKFNYYINVEENLLEEQIPTLLIQPFVENSIRHGIMHIEQVGIIRIDISKVKNGLEVTIEDNGIGRAKSTEIQTNKEGHKSRGTSITESRLELLNSVFGSEMNVEYIDLKDNNNNAIGTKVKILIQN
ncbi:MAG: tetratricopeptide repeat protein [Bacteroidales bacterium]|nr:tetratricopeptide repeat protein [Bacteroidales bacterium]